MSLEIPNRTGGQLAADRCEKGPKVEKKLKTGQHAEDLSQGEHANLNAPIAMNNV